MNDRVYIKMTRPGAHVPCGTVVTVVMRWVEQCAIMRGSFPECRAEVKRNAALQRIDATLVTIAIFDTYFLVLFELI